MARCESCNAVMNNSAIFCSRCGARLATSASAESPPAPADAVAGTASETASETAAETGAGPEGPPAPPRRPLTAMELLATPPPSAEDLGPDPASGAMAPASTSINGFAVASFVLGLTWLLWLGSVLAIVFGFVAISRIDSSRGTQRGRVLAIVGIALGVVAIGSFVLLVIVSAITDSGQSSRLG